MKYEEGLDMNQFNRVDEISHYNHNYYIGLSPFDLLFEKSDDDDTSEWYLIKGKDTIFLGESYCSDGDKLRVRFA